MGRWPRFFVRYASVRITRERKSGFWFFSMISRGSCSGAFIGQRTSSVGSREPFRGKERIHQPSLYTCGSRRSSDLLKAMKRFLSSVFRKLTRMPISSVQRQVRKGASSEKKIIKMGVVYFVRGLDLSNCASLPCFSKKTFFFHLPSQNHSYCLLKSDNPNTQAKSQSLF